MSEIEIIREPLTYEVGKPHSFCRDLVLSEAGDNRAKDRLGWHRREMDVELPKLEARSRQAPDAAFEYRTNPTSSSNLSPPLWVVEQYASALRPKRVLANLVPQFPLPSGAHSVNLPRLTTGTQVQPQQDGAAVPGQDIVDTSSQSIVTTFSGQADTSLQLLEQSAPGAHLDFVLFKDMTEAYDAQLELALLNGSGTAENLLGVLNCSMPTANKVAYTDATPTGAEMVAPLAQAFAAVGNNRKVPAERWLMTSSRWAWLSTQVSVTGGNQLLIADWGPEGQGMISLKAEWDDAIPTALSGNQDAILCVRPSDMMLWEGTPRTTIQTEELSGTLQARLQFHNSAAFIVRYPAGQATVTGTGMVIQANF